MKKCDIKNLDCTSSGKTSTRFANGIPEVLEAKIAFSFKWGNKFLYTVCLILIFSATASIIRSQSFNFSKSLSDNNIDFVIEPYVRFEGLPGEQKTMFFYDNSGNALEFKSFKDIEIFVEAKKPIIIATIPATNCRGTISTWGYLLTIKIRVAKVIGITKATIFPDICPLDRVFPSIKINPRIAKNIEAKVIFEIFYFQKKYPKN